MAWSTPKTDWTAGDGLANGDMNRIEENIRMMSQVSSAYGATTGTANVYSVTTAPPITSLTEGACVAVKINVNNTGASTINVNGLGVKTIKRGNGNDVASGQLKAGSIYTLRYNGTNFVLQGEGGAGNAVASDLLSGKTASTDAGDIVGTMPDRRDNTIIYDIDTRATIYDVIASDGYPDSGIIKLKFIPEIAGYVNETTQYAQYVKGLLPANIKKDVKIGNDTHYMTGTYDPIPSQIQGKYVRFGDQVTPKLNAINSNWTIGWGHKDSNLTAIWRYDIAADTELLASYTNDGGNWVEQGACCSGDGNHYFFKTNNNNFYRFTHTVGSTLIGTYSPYYSFSNAAGTVLYFTVYTSSYCLIKWEEGVGCTVIETNLSTYAFCASDDLAHIFYWKASNLYKLGTGLILSSSNALSTVSIGAANDGSVFYFNSTDSSWRRWKAGVSYTIATGLTAWNVSAAVSYVCAYTKDGSYFLYYMATGQYLYDTSTETVVKISDAELIQGFRASSWANMNELYNNGGIITGANTYARVIGSEPTLKYPMISKIVKLES